MTAQQRNLIGVSFPEQRPTDVEELQESEAYCRFIGIARDRGPFSILADNVNCPLARYHLAIGEPDLPGMTDTLLRWGHSRNRDIAVAFLESAVRLTRPFRYIVFFRYPHERLRAELLIRICNVEEALRVVRAYSGATGERVNSPLSAEGAACGECTSYVLMKGAPTLSVGCGGSRPKIGLAADEVLVAAPFGSTMADLLAEVQ